MEHRASARPEARKRLVALVPGVVRKLRDGWPTDDAAKVRRKVFLTALYACHTEAMTAALVPTLPDDPDAIEPAPGRVATALPESGATTAEASDTLLRGDWCLFEGEPGDASLLAKFAWAAPHGTQLLFTHRDGSVAVVHTPASFGRAVQEGRARIVVEAAPLFERAMGRLLEARTLRTFSGTAA